MLGAVILVGYVIFLQLIGQPMPINPYEPPKEEGYELPQAEPSATPATGRRLSLLWVLLFIPGMFLGTYVVAPFLPFSVGDPGGRSVGGGLGGFAGLLIGLLICFLVRASNR